MKIGVAALVPYRGKIVGIICSKGRGITLPGGKWDGEHETFVQAAVRELREECGLAAQSYEFFFSGLLHDGFFNYTFILPCLDEDIQRVIGRDFGEGKVVETTWLELCESKYRGYYQILQQLWTRRMKEQFYNSKLGLPHYPPGVRAANFIAQADSAARMMNLSGATDIPGPSEPLRPGDFNYKKDLSDANIPSQFPRVHDVSAYAPEPATPEPTAPEDIPF